MNSEALRLLDELFACIERKDLCGCVGYGDKLRARLSAQEPTGWRPIETAPRDGTRVLLALSHGGVVLGKWWILYLNGEVDRGRMAMWDTVPHVQEHGGSCIPLEPTHWMPLPAPPGELAKQEAK